MRTTVNFGLQASGRSRTRAGFSSWVLTPERQEVFNKGGLKGHPDKGKENRKKKGATKKKTLEHPRSQKRESKRLPKFERFPS